MRVEVMMDIGKMVYPMVKEKYITKEVNIMKVILEKVKEKDMVYINVMIILMMENG